MNLLCRCAGFIIESFIGREVKQRGGGSKRLIRSLSHSSCGGNRVHTRTAHPSTTYRVHEMRAAEVHRSKLGDIQASAPDLLRPITPIVRYDQVGRAASLWARPAKLSIQPNSSSMRLRWRPQPRGAATASDTLQCQTPSLTACRPAEQP